MNAQVEPKQIVEPRQINDTTEKAVQSQMLAPRFYTTDYKALDKLDVESVRPQWDAMMAEYKADRNKGHFKQEFVYDETTLKSDPELYQEFLNFLTSSITSEYSGCILYQEIRKNVDNKDIAELMGYMARDESRHAGFINQALKQLEVAVDLGFLKRQKDYTFFKPKFIYYATYLSEKIGYARYITIYRHLEKHPEHRFHPIFNWFLEWCNDEFRHGESFALLIRTQPELLRGRNKLWIRFFLLAVYATMYVRDHSRPKLYEALGMDPTEYDYKVFDITTEISKQVYPFTLNTDDPRMRRGFDKLLQIQRGIEAANARGGVLGFLKAKALAAQGGLVFARMYLLPTIPNELPEESAMAPAW